MKAPVAPVDGVRESKENTLDIFATGLILNESRARTQDSRRAARNNPTWGVSGNPRLRVKEESTARHLERGCVKRG